MAANFRIFSPATATDFRNSRDSFAAAALSSFAATRTLRRSSPSNRREYSSSARSPRLRTSARMGRTTASASLNLAALRANNRPTCFDSRIRIIPSHHYLIQRILDDPLRAGLLEARDDIAHGRLVENRIYRQPFVIAQMRDGGPLQRRKHIEHGAELILVHV